MEKERLDEILKAHYEWLETRLADDVKGELANLIYEDLRGVEMSGVDLRWANMRGVEMSGADLRWADLRWANMRGVEMSGADLRWADLRGANLHGANLYGANLSGADLRGADLYGADLSGSVCPICCPENGSFIGFKKAKDNYIVELLITENAKRSSATTRKCRCSEAVVMSITTLEGKEAEEKTVCSKHDPGFTYTVGETVHVDNFDENRWNECSTGIHFFITRQEAVNYEL